MSTENERNFAAYMRELKFIGADLDTVSQNVVSKQAATGMRVSIRNTPVKSGVLRRTWTAIKSHKDGNAWEAGYGNVTFYGPYVNDGHRQQVGRYVAAIKKRLVRPYVPGVHMLEQGIDAANRQTNSFFNEEIDKAKQRSGF